MRREHEPTKEELLNARKVVNTLVKNPRADLNEVGHVMNLIDERFEHAPSGKSFTTKILETAVRRRWLITTATAALLSSNTVGSFISNTYQKFSESYAHEHDPEVLKQRQEVIEANLTLDQRISSESISHFRVGYTPEEEGVEYVASSVPFELAGVSGGIELKRPPAVDNNNTHTNISIDLYRKASGIYVPQLAILGTTENPEKWLLREDERVLRLLYRNTDLLYFGLTVPNQQQPFIQAKGYLKIRK